jgi:hypothetical protein
MTHDELKAKLLISDETSIYETLRLFQEALFAIVKLHKPFKVNDTWLCECEPVEYPCLTIQAIEKELA